MRKSSNSKRHYRPGTSRGGLSLVTFREQMTDYARGDRFLELRAERRMSREEVAHAIGVTTKSLYTWEKQSGAIKSENAKQVAKFYGIPDWTELVTRDPEATGPSSRGQVNEGFDEFRKHVDDLHTHVTAIHADIGTNQKILEAVAGYVQRQEGILESIERLLKKQDKILKNIERAAAGLPSDDAITALRQELEAQEARDRAAAKRQPATSTEAGRARRRRASGE